MSNDELGNRMKGYENVSRHYLTPRVPVLVRVDGRHFHSLKLQKPYDYGFIECMVDSALYVAKEMEGCKAVYIQSDEATFLLTDYDNINTQGWFGYNINKLVSISSGLMSVKLSKLLWPTVVFDSRTFNVPKDDVVNSFLWRAKDWYRNSVQMYAQSMFSHKELDKKSTKDLLEMTYQKGFNWNDLDNRVKNGTFLTKESDGFVSHSSILPYYDAIEKLLNQYLT